MTPPVWQNVALIAPASNLSYVEDEVRAVSAALRPASLRGEVTLQNVVDLLSSRSWDIVWFSAHGGREGVQLSNGEVLPSDRLIPLIRSCGARLVVFNTCESELIAYRTYEETGAVVIGTITTVGDPTAFVTGTLLAKNLAAGMEIIDAYNRSRPGEASNSQYKIYNRKATPGEGIATWMELMALALQPIQKQMNGLDEGLRDLKTGVDGLRSQFRDLAEVSMTRHPVRRFVWVLGAVLFAAALMAGQFVLGEAHGVPWVSYIPLQIAGLSVSIAMLAYGIGFFGGTDGRL
jgi:CHAT domain